MIRLSTLLRLLPVLVLVFWFNLTCYPLQAQVITCSTSGGILYFDGTNYVCSLAISADGSGVNLHVNSGAFTAKIDNGQQVADQYNTSNNGILNAAAAGQTTYVSPLYTGTDIASPTNETIVTPLMASLPSNTAVYDYRAGKTVRTYKDAYDPGRLSDIVRYFAHSETLFNIAPHPVQVATSAYNAPSGHVIFNDFYENPSLYAAPSLSNGTTYSGYTWQTRGGMVLNTTARTTGITHAFGCNMRTLAGGDNECFTAYMTNYPGGTAGADERTEPLYLSATIAKAHTVGTAPSTVTSPTNLTLTCVSNCADNGDHRPVWVSTQPTQAYVDVAGAVTNWTQTLTYNAGTLPVSTAWGVTTSADLTSISIPSGGSLDATITNTPKLRNLIISLTDDGISSPGSFVVGQKVCIAGPYFDRAMVTAVLPASGGSQVVQVAGRFPAGAGMEVFQGGLCGSGMVPLRGDSWANVYAGHDWIGYPILGSTSATTFKAYASTQGGQNGPQGAFKKSDFNYSATLVTRTSDIVSYRSPANNGPSGNITRGAMPNITWTYTSSTGSVGSCSFTTGISYPPGQASVSGIASSNMFQFTAPSGSGCSGADVTTAGTGNIAINGTDNITILPMGFVTWTKSTPSGSAGIYIELDPNDFSLTAADMVEIGSTYSGGGLNSRLLMDCQVQPDINGCVGLQVQMQSTLPYGWSNSQQAGIVVSGNNTFSNFIGYGGSRMPGNMMNVSGAYATGINFTQAPIMSGAAGTIIRVGPPVNYNGGANSWYPIIGASGYGTHPSFLMGFDPVGDQATFAVGNNVWTHNSTTTAVTTVGSGSLALYGCTSATLSTTLAFCVHNTLANSFRVDTNGNVGVGVTPSGAYKMDVNGPVRVSSLQGTGTATFAVAAAAQVGSGATAVCATSHVCDAISGDVLLNTGTGTLTAGTVLTITTGITRTNLPNCSVRITGGNTYLSESPTYSTTQLTLSVANALSPSTTYHATYICGGV